MHSKDQERRKYINQICEQLGCTQDSCGNWKFPNAAAEDTFESLMDSYDVAPRSHSNAVIISTLTGLRFTQCPKCQERHVLSPGFVHGSHLCCKGCGENLLLQELSMGELENFKAAQVNWNLGERRASFTMCPPRLRFPIERPPVGGGKTAAMLGALAHAEFAKYCEADINNVRESLKLVEQTTVRRLTVKAAFKLGKVAKTYLTREERNAAKKEIKAELATTLKLCGIPYREIELIISELVEGLRNE
jgi:hypothetical protein